MADENALKDKKATELIRLRQRFLDLQKLGALTPESFGMFQQSFMEVYQEAEKRRQACLAQADELRRKASAAESQSHAYSTISSILYSIVDGHIGIEQKRLVEEQAREDQTDGGKRKVSASGGVYEEGDEEEKPQKPSKAPKAKTTK